MTETTQDGPDSFSRFGRAEVDYERYADVNVEDGHVMVYDIDESDAWIQSNVAIPIEDVP